MIADLHESFETETAPIYDQAMRAHNRTHTPPPRHQEAEVTHTAPHPQRITPPLRRNRGCLMSDFLRDSIGIRSRFTIPAARPAFSCGRCGDDSEPADCPDRMSFEDHGLCCMGTCLACQHRIDQGETE